MMHTSTQYYLQKLRFEIDSSDLFETLKTEKNIQILDVRKKTAFEWEHIPGAWNIPYAELEGMAAQLNQDLLYITYCDGIGCNASTKGALQLAQLGFQVKELMGGLDWWKRDGYATQGLNAADSLEKTCNC
jgi:rhodanese-related sulfurtransferase